MGPIVSQGAPSRPSAHAVCPLYPGEKVSAGIMVIRYLGLFPPRARQRLRCLFNKLAMIAPSFK